MPQARGAQEAARSAGFHNGTTVMIKPLEFERISVEEAAKAIERTVRPGKVKDWEGERKPTPPEPLSKAAATWLVSLPFPVRPNDLACQFPRIANRLCELWKRPAQCDAYIRTLIIDERGGRKGFPPAVAKELSSLAAHYASVHPYRHSIWDDVIRK
jgi:hypothetical protein